MSMPIAAVLQEAVIMVKKVILAGFLGGFFLILWTFLINGVLGLRVYTDMNTFSGDREVYELLKNRLQEPGRYILNPEISPENGFPAGEKVFSIYYSGIGHESAGKLLWMNLAIAFLAPLLGALLLSITSASVRSSFIKKVAFFSSIGMLLAVYNDLMSFGIGGYPFGSALLLALNDFVSWTMLGIVVAWRMGPAGSARPTRTNL